MSTESSHLDPAAKPDKDPVPPEDITFSDLPQGITVRGLRDSLSPGTQLLVRFTFVDGSSLLLEFEVGEQRYVLSPDIPYVVTHNDSGTPWVFLNPLGNEPSTLQEESNIPISLDEKLATRFSNLIRRQAWVSEGDLAVVFSTIEKRRESQAAHQNFEKQCNEFYERDLSHLVEEKCQSTGLSQLQAGSNLRNTVGHLIYAAIEASHFAALEKNESVEVPIVAAEILEKFFTAIAEIIQRRIPQLEHLVADADTIGIAFDEYDFLIDGLGPMDLVSVYTKRDGWSVSAPYANCAVQASQTLGNYLQDRLPKEHFQKFLASLEQAEQRGSIHIDRENKIVVSDGLIKILMQDLFIFHDDDTIEHAIETLAACGHPYIGETVFKFILFKMAFDRPFVNEEPIVIEL